LGEANTHYFAISVKKRRFNVKQMPCYFLGSMAKYPDFQGVEGLSTGFRWRGTLFQAIPGVSPRGQFK